MFFFDPLYMAVMAVGMVLSFGAQWWVKRAVKKWSQVPIGKGMTGAEVAARILESERVTGVRIEEVPGFLSDHYDPRNRTLRLSPDNYHGRSVTAAGIAAHEVGHALQHRDGYAPMKLRQAMVPVANIGTRLGFILVFIGALVGMMGIAKIGVAIFAGFVVFTLVTLPVEFDASARAKRALAAGGILGRHESDGVSEVLNAAAATYVAAAAAAILQLVYLLIRSGLLGGRDD